MSENLNTTVDKSPIYVITVFESFKKIDEYTVQIESKSLIGFRHTLQGAIEALSLNMCDIWEGCYHYAVVEEVYPFLYPDCEKRLFFHFNRNNQCYEPIDEPVEFHKYGPFSFL